MPNSIKKAITKEGASPVSGCVISRAKLIAGLVPIKNANHRKTPIPISISTDPKRFEDHLIVLLRFGEELILPPGIIIIQPINLKIGMPDIEHPNLLFPSILLRLIPQAMPGDPVPAVLWR
jgi:hypothetical protein